MNRKTVLVAALLLLAGAASRPGRRVLFPKPAARPAAATPTAPAPGPPDPRGEAGLPVTALPPIEAEPPPDPEAERVRRLVRETTALMKQAGTLSADDGEQFERLANLTNEFDHGLDTGTAALLVRHMPPGFLATPWGDMALRRWAREDRAAAAAWMAAHPDPSPVAATALMHDWFARDAEAARAYVAAQPEGIWKTHVATSVAEEALVAGQPAEVVRFLALSGAENPRREELQEWTAIQWGRTSYTQANAWAAQAATPGQRERLLAAVNVGYANIDPLAAAEAMLEQVKNPTVARPALGSIVRIWAATDARAAADWVSAFPPGPEKETAVGELLAVWAHADHESARRWQTSLKDPAARDHAARILDTLD